jgi:serine/threonine protein kinase
MALEQGFRFGSYEILSPLGSGGMGEVYRARDVKLDRDVAVKVLRDEYAADTERLERFEREARAASALNHPNIVTIYDIGDAGSTRFIAMELIRGRTVRHILQEWPVPVSDIIDIAAQSAEGLAKAHEAGIVHRDLKPENLMVTEDGFVKILDFGLAKLQPRPFELDSEGTTLIRHPTRSGTILGTVEYMSPEQASGQPADHRADQFTLGLVLYEMAAGERPFERATAAQTLAAIIEAEATPLSEKNPVVPPGLSAIVGRCLAKDPRHRYESTRDLALALRDLKKDPKSALDRPPAPPPERAPVRRLGQDSDYYVQTDDGVRKMSERKLRKKLRRNDFSGLEMVRRDGEDRWELLHDSTIFVEEVPVRGEARDAARWRLIRGFGGHLAAFIGVGIFMQFPLWMAFWGIGLVSHGLRVLPVVLEMRREGKLRLPGRAGGPKLLGKGTKQLVSPEFIEEVERVRSLLKRRKKDERRELLAEVDGLVQSMSALAAKQMDLEEQTSKSELDQLKQSDEKARAKLATAEGAHDRKLFERQIEVLETRRRAIDKALWLLDRMRIRRSLTEHQLKQLRLDLSQAEARRMDGPELSSRILDIRHEVDAIDEVDEALA